MDSVDFNPYYDAIHKPYFALENFLMQLIPFRLNISFMGRSNHSKHFPFMQIEVVLFFTAIYLVVCLIGKYRTSRYDHPFFKFLVNVYNACLVALSAFMVVTVLIESSRLGYTWFNNPVDESPKTLPLAKALSIFYLSKFPELLDTVIMAIKGNTRQISFLHIYHHTSIIFFWYCIIYATPYSECYFAAFQNSFIHTLMYSYYLLTSMRAGLFLTRRLKKYMTQLQMGQFVLNCIQTFVNVYMYYNGKSNGYPLVQNFLLFGYMVSLLILFGNFYFRDRKREATDEGVHLKKKQQ
eukprot:NODE_156_length_16689_cov_0.273960.p6 type:complete len:295 gc:universal NODE_156_length_16689_cov_0.273960:4323-5207(+)